MVDVVTLHVIISSIPSIPSLDVGVRAWKMPTELELPESYSVHSLLASPDVKSRLLL